MGTNKFKQFNKYEIVLLAINILIWVNYYIIRYFRIPVDFSLLTGITVIASIALLLITIAYHIDRENDWKKQQALTPSTLQN